MKKKIFIFTFIALTLSFSDAFASCEIPNRLKIDTIVDDVTMFALGHESLTTKLMNSKGYGNYDEYTYSNESYSKAIIQIQNNYKNLGEKYSSVIIPRLKEKQISMSNAFKKIMQNCDHSQIEKSLSDGLLEALSGKNRSIEMELVQINLNAISDALK
ncbi:hypothetical protein [Rheinheimera sp.]|uniref:hypothetical protein n=1 Tax=Rheinheimera sp. TaxID=1869214 RepID=UPI004047EA3C